MTASQAVALTVPIARAGAEPIAAVAVRKPSAGAPRA